MTRMIAASLLLTVGAGFAAASARASQPPARSDTGLVDRFLNPSGPALVSYRARRTLTASSMGGRMSATVDAWTRLDPDGRFDFEVISESGSGLIRGRVLLKALETERDAHNQRATDRAEITLANYEFSADATADGEMARIALLPRRRSQMLLNGTVTVRRSDGDLIALEGQPAESPSWWTRRVDISRRYARINGVRVPVEMSSRADVRIAGDSSFLMTYDYVAINGVTIRR